MAKRGEHFSAELKFKVVMEVIREEGTLAQIASKYNVTTKSLTKWKREFIDNGVKIFTREKDKKEEQKKQEEQAKYIEKLQSKVGELTVQLDWLKKKSEELDIISGRRKR